MRLLCAQSCLPRLHGQTYKVCGFRQDRLPVCRRNESGQSREKSRSLLPGDDPAVLHEDAGRDLIRGCEPPPVRYRGGVFVVPLVSAFLLAWICWTDGYIVGRFDRR